MERLSVGDLHYGGLKMLFSGGLWLSMMSNKIS